ncbi:MAG: cohesin domain-containing protein [Candidatus Neomarinimicrobiota bacterium]
MHSIKLLISILILLFGCEKLPVKSFDNPLDVVESKLIGVSLPALVFFPDSVSIQTGETITLGVYAMEVNELSGAHIQINYEKQKINISSVLPGELLNSTTEPFFNYNNDTLSGILDIYTTSYGLDSLETGSETGSLANIEIRANVPGKIIIQYTDSTEFVDQNDNPIKIKTKLPGIIDVWKSQ